MDILIYVLEVLKKLQPDRILTVKEIINLLELAKQNKIDFEEKMS